MITFVIHKFFINRISPDIYDDDDDDDDDDVVVQCGRIGIFKAIDIYNTKFDAQFNGEAPNQYEY